MEPLEKQLTELIGEIKTFKAKAQEDIGNLGTVNNETKTTLEALRADLSAKQAQLDALDAKLAKKDLDIVEETESIGDLFTKSEKYKEALASEFRSKERIVYPMKRSAFPIVERKSTITSGGLGAGTSGVQMPMLLTGSPLPLAQIGLRVRNLMRVRTMSEGSTYYWLKQSTRTNTASPQPETSPKAESTYAWDTASDDVTTIAHYTKVSTQALSDVPWLRNTVDSELMYGLLLAEETEILAGSGTGQHLNGLITQATAYDTATYNQASDTRLDKLRHAKLQARLAGLATFAPDGLVLNPVDLEKIELIKTEEGAANKGVYVVGDPKSGAQVTTVWGLSVVESDAIAAGYFLLGAFRTAAELIDRLQARVDISFENEDDFIRNKATIRAEERVGLAVERPTAFIYGTFA